MLKISYAILQTVVDKNLILSDTDYYLQEILRAILNQQNIFKKYLN